MPKVFNPATGQWEEPNGQAAPQAGRRMVLNPNTMKLEAAGQAATTPEQPTGRRMVLNPGTMKLEAVGGQEPPLPTAPLPTTPPPAALTGNFGYGGAKAPPAAEPPGATKGVMPSLPSPALEEFGAVGDKLEQILGRTRMGASPEEMQVRNALPPLAVTNLGTGGRGTGHYPGQNYLYPGMGVYRQPRDADQMQYAREAEENKGIRGTWLAAMEKAYPAIANAVGNQALAKADYDKMVAMILGDPNTNADQKIATMNVMQGYHANPNLANEVSSQTQAGQNFEKNIRKVSEGVDLKKQIEAILAAGITAESGKLPVVDYNVLGQAIAERPDVMTRGMAKLVEEARKSGLPGGEDAFSENLLKSLMYNYNAADTVGPETQGLGLEIFKTGDAGKFGFGFGKKGMRYRTPSGKVIETGSYAPPLTGHMPMFNPITDAGRSEARARAEGLAALLKALHAQGYGLPQTVGQPK